MGRNRRGTVAGLLKLACAVWSCCGAVSAHAQISAPETSSGDYTVSYAGCSGCYIHWLEERVSGSGAWVALGESSVHFTDKPDGTYDYRAAFAYMYPDYSFQLVYSNVVTVLVAEDLPVVQELPAQLAHRYEVRMGDYDSNGSGDLFVERIEGGDGNDGTLWRVMLSAVAGRFEPIVPTAAQIDIARTWPRVDVGLTLRDINVDGFVDVVMSGIGTLPGLTGVPGQIILAPGRAMEALPQAVRPIGDELRTLGRDLRNYFEDPHYFAVNAPLTVVTVTYYDYSCMYAGWDTSFYAQFDYCFPYPITTYLLVPDYSSFAAAAVRLWDYESAIDAGAMSRQSAYDEIEALIEESLGAPLGSHKLKKLLGESAEALDPVSERAMELFSALAGISNASAQEADSEDSGVQAGAIDSVLLTGRRLVGFGPFHTAVQYGSATISAHDNDPRVLYDGTLVSQVNWPPDHPLLTLRLGTVASPLTATYYWQRLLQADAGYGDNLPYDLLPSVGNGGYNSNSFVSGLIAATDGVASVSMSKFVGGERPVPRGEFY